MASTVIWQIADFSDGMTNPRSRTVNSSREGSVPAALTRRGCALCWVNEVERLSWDTDNGRRGSADCVGSTTSIPGQPLCVTLL